MGIKSTEKPYEITKLVTTPMGTPPFYQLVIISFPSPEVLQTAMASPQVQELMADAVRISSGGAPVFMVGMPPQ